MAIIETENDAKLAAFWLLGVQGAWAKRGVPKWVDRQIFSQHYATAVLIAGGGKVFNPVKICDLLNYVEDLSNKVTPPLRFAATPGS